MNRTEAQKAGLYDRSNEHYTPIQIADILEKLAEGRDRSLVATTAGRTENAIDCLVNDLLAGRKDCPDFAESYLEQIKQAAQKADRSETRKLDRPDRLEKQVQQIRDMVAGLKQDVEAALFIGRLQIALTVIGGPTSEGEIARLLKPVYPKQYNRLRNLIVTLLAERKQMRGLTAASETEPAKTDKHVEESSDESLAETAGETAPQTDVAA